MRKIILMICLLGFSLEANAQCATLDSLYRILRVAKSDTDKINTLNVLAEELNQIGKVAQAAFYTRQSLQLSQKINYSRGIADAMTHIAILDYEDLNEYRGNIEDFNQALALYRETKDLPRLARTLEIIGTYYAKSPDKESREKAIAIYTEAQQTYEQLKNLQKQIDIYETLGTLYGLLGDDQQAIRAFRASLQLTPKTDLQRVVRMNHLLKYERVAQVEARLKKTSAFSLIVFFGIVTSILLVICVALFLQKKKIGQAYQAILEAQ
ncbi:MAG: hypothetical protein AAFU64_07105, partial [Bacteroidota bacterium]